MKYTNSLSFTFKFNCTPFNFSEKYFVWTIGQSSQGCIDQIIVPRANYWSPKNLTCHCLKSLKNKSYARLRHMLKIHHQASFVWHFLKLSLPSCCFHVGILFIFTALGIGPW